MKDFINSIKNGALPSSKDIACFIDNHSDDDLEYLFSCARSVAIESYGSKVFVRGLIEFTNFCRNNCYYCGIRRDNKNVSRYRLTKEDILKCCDLGNELGFQTFVLQGGEDPFYSDSQIADIISSIKEKYPKCAVTLSFGEQSKKSYKLWKDAGADRYLLRHETASSFHYAKLHPSSLTLEKRVQCLEFLKDLGFQVGSGFMVGSPYQSSKNLAEDLLFLAKFKPHMIGIGPFIPHCETPFSKFKAGELNKTLLMVSLARLTLPKALIPSTTALGTIDPLGREKGILAGANVVMPNLSPKEVREKYMLYNGKLCTGDEAAESVESLKKLIESIGYNLSFDRGDSLID